ncbi:MAG TPA: phosphotransferase, partial [Longimicrobiaceae bacterium]|nr:phosphotransferase [Longimicrobiaceae bacterium]
LRPDEDSPSGWGPPSRLLSELTTLGLLGRSAVAPALLAAAPRSGLLVLEDVAGAAGLHSLLLAPDPVPAEAALLDLAATLGRLHAAGRALVPEHRRARDRLAPLRIPYSKAFRGMVEPDGFAAVLARACAAVDVRPSAAAVAELEALRRFWDEPGPFLTLLHGDVCPDNFLWTEDGGGRLVDFEFSAPGHALADAAFARLGFPACWCAGRLPEPLVERMEQAYRRELPAMDDAVFTAGMAEAYAFWALGALSWALPRALDADEGWGETPLRQRIVSQLETAAGLAVHHGRLEALGAAYAALAARLRERWGPALEVSLFPAFRSGA